MPVRAWPITSSPASASGRVSSWIANVRSIPAAPSARTISSRTPSSANVGESSRTGGTGLERVRWVRRGKSGLAVLQQDRIEIFYV